MKLELIEVKTLLVIISSLPRRCIEVIDNLRDSLKRISIDLKLGNLHSQLREILFCFICYVLLCIVLLILADLVGIVFDERL